MLRDKDKIVVRISFEAKLVTESEMPIKYDSNEEEQGAIIIPKGAKIVMLNYSEQKPYLLKIVAFWKSKYRIGFIKTEMSYLEMTQNDFTAFTEESSTIFLNDIEHLLYHRLAFYELENETKAMYELLEKKYKKLKDDVNFTSTYLQEKYNTYCKMYYNSFLRSGKIANKVAYLSRLEKAIFKTNNPKKISDGLLICPLSEDWMNEKLIDFYNENFINSKGSIFFDAFKYNVGQIYYDNMGTEFIEILRKLKVAVAKKQLIAPEAYWIKKLNIDKLKKENTHIIVLGNDVWSFSPNSRIVQTSEVSQNDFHGPIRFNQLFTLLCHEINVSAVPKKSFFMKSGQDTHINHSDNIISDSSYVLSSLYDMIDGKLDLDKATFNGNNSLRIDSLYQSHSFMSLVNTLIFLNT